MDLYTDNNDNLDFKNKDITMLNSPIYPILSLRNYLRKNKYEILKGTNDITNIYNIVINKALELNLNPNSLILNKNDLINGDFNLQVKLSAKEQV